MNNNTKFYLHDAFRWSVFFLTTYVITDLINWELTRFQIWLIFAIGYSQAVFQYIYYNRFMEHLK